MKLSNKQELDLKSCLYFQNGEEPTEEDIKAYFAWSDRGDKSFLSLDTPGASRIRYGKQYRDVQVTSYKEDWGHYITVTDFMDEPRWFCEWLSNVLKKPAILSMYKVFHDEKLNKDDAVNLDPMLKFVEIIRGEELQLQVEA